MAKKKVSKKKVSKKVEPVQTKKSEPSGFEVFGVIVLILLIGYGIYKGGSYLFGTGTSIEKGQCYVDRAYNPVKVTHVYRSWNEVELVEMVAKESTLFDGYYLVEKDGYTKRSRTKDFVEKNYALVECHNFHVRE